MAFEQLSLFTRLKFLKRLASAVVLAPIVLAIIYTGGAVFDLALGLCAALALFEWLSLSQKTRHSVILLLAGFIYLSVCFVCFYWMRIHYLEVITVLFILLMWAGDSGAYFAGKLIGGPKMALEVSPNKTWAGLIGAILTPAMVALIYFCAFAGHGFAVGAIVLSVVCGLIAGGIGQFGDLVISSLKRQAQAKDSGQLIPGHGGLLDRIDSILLATPVFLFLVSKYKSMFIVADIIP